MKWFFSSILEIFDHIVIEVKVEFDLPYNTFK